MTHFPVRTHFLVDWPVSRPWPGTDARTTARKRKPSEKRWMRWKMSIPWFALQVWRCGVENRLPYSHRVPQRTPRSRTPPKKFKKETEPQDLRNIVLLHGYSLEISCGNIPRIPWWGIHALARVASMGSWQTVAAMATDPDELVRVAAVRAMGRMAEPGGARGGKWWKWVVKWAPNYSNPHNQELYITRL